MAIQLSVAVRNARGNAIETTIGTSAVLRLRTGSPPANCAAADSGTVAVEMTLPSDWLANAASGVKAISGTWEDTDADGGTVGHFRIYDSGGTTCGMQGTVTAEGGGGDMEIDTTTIIAGRVVTIVTFSLTEANA